MQDISCAFCKRLVYVCATKKLVPRHYFFVSRAPYCTPYRKDFNFIRLHISYDLMYLKFYVITYLFRSAGNTLLYVWVLSIERQSLAKVCVCVFIKILNMATICFPQQSRHWDDVITPSKRSEINLVSIMFEWSQAL